MKNYNAAFFDLDGTLADNYAAIHSTLCEAFAEYGAREPSYDDVFNIVGGSIQITIKKLLEKYGEDLGLLHKIGDSYFRIYPERAFYGLKAMPYAKEILHALKSQGMRLACFTNKQTEGAEAVLRKLGLREYFDGVAATSFDSPRKPDAEFTINALNMLCVSAEESVGIGDSPYDYKAALAGKMDSALVATGSDSQELLLDNCPNAVGVYANLAELAVGVFDVEI